MLGTEYATSADVGDGIRHPPLSHPPCMMTAASLPLVVVTRRDELPEVPMANRSLVAVPSVHSPSFQIVVLSGTVHGVIVSGVTSTGESLCSFDLAVFDDNRRCLVPLTWRNVETPLFAAGDSLLVRGRVVKRFHRAGATTVARTSVEVDEVIESPKPAAIRRLVARSVEHVSPERPRAPRRT